MLKNIPVILQEINLLTAMPVQGLNMTNIQAEKFQEINKKLEVFYSNQPAAVTAAAMTDIQNGKPSLIDYFMVKTQNVLFSFYRLNHLIFF